MEPWNSQCADAANAATAAVNVASAAKTERLNGETGQMGPIGMDAAECSRRMEIQHDVMVDGIQFWMTIVDFLFRSGGGSKLEGVWYLG